MKTFTLSIIGLLIFSLSIAQSINKISTFDNNYNSNSGIIGITDSAIYEYSWYYDQWLEFPTTGLAIVDESPIINEVSAFDNNSHNPSGIYVISDTAVHVYNYYAEFWYALYNTGLERLEGVVQLSDLSAHLDLDTEDVDVFVKSGDHIYYYEWYTQQWYQLPNEGIATIGKVHSVDIEMSIFPNPVQLNSTISYNLPENYNAAVKIAIFSEDGKLVKEITENNQKGGNHEITLNVEDFASGIYFYEISGLNFSHVKKFIKFD